MEYGTFGTMFMCMYSMQGWDLEVKYTSGSTTHTRREVASRSRSQLNSNKPTMHTSQCKANMTWKNSCYGNTWQAQTKKRYKEQFHCRFGQIVFKQKKKWGGHDFKYSHWPISWTFSLEQSSKLWVVLQSLCLRFIDYLDIFTMTVRSEKTVDFIGAFWG